MSEKRSLRTEMREARRAYVASLKPLERDELLAALADSILGRLPAEGIVAVYSAYGDEVDAALIAAALGDRVAYPYFADRNAPMAFRLTTGTFEGGPFGILQPPEEARPVDADILLVPMIAGDQHCHRLGQGKGHYDRALAALSEKKKTYHTIGLAWDVQIIDEVPRDEWDVPLDAIATPTRWIAPLA